MQQSAKFDRRTVLRTAAHAAWLAPAISIAGAVPVVAASSGAAQFGWGATPGSAVDSAITFTLFAFNSGSQAGAPVVQVELTYAPAGHAEPDTALPILFVGAGDEWTVQDVGVSNVKTITYNGTVPVGGVATLSAGLSFLSVGNAAKLLRAAVSPSAQGPADILQWTA